MHNDIALTVDLQIPKSYTLEYEIPIVSYFAIDIPGIVNIGPEVNMGIELTFKAEAKLEAKTEFTSSLTGGHVHVDFLNSANTLVDNWNPIHQASANLSVGGTLSMTPKVVNTDEIACALFDEALDLSTGVEITAGFPLTFGATATQTGASSNDTIELPETEECPNGFGYKAEFAITVKAFATSWISKEWEVYTKPIGAWCMPWLKL